MIWVARGRLSTATVCNVDAAIYLECQILVVPKHNTSAFGAR
jgi:hypothetical protein